MISVRVILSLLLFITGCGAGFHRNCPNTDNVKWYSLPATIKPDNLSSGEIEVLSQAIINWNLTLDGEYLKIDTSSRNKIMNGGITLPYDVQGRAIRTTIGSYITHVNIYINPNNSRDLDLESLYIHELGHFLGVDHITGTVMNPSLPDRVYRIEIEQIVIDSVKCLYENR